MIPIKTNASATLTTQELASLAESTGNLYASIAIIGRRARQISGNIKEELSDKLAEFVPAVDNLEEIFENREQIEVSRHYERLPKPTQIALDEFLAGKVAFRKPEAPDQLPEL